MPARIEIEALRKSYGGAVALDVERLSIEPGETLALVGPSGCGKSTLLRLIVGLVAPDRGGVTIDGTPMLPKSRRALRLGTGYVIQEGGLFPHLTAGENVALVARDLGWAAERIRSRVDELNELTRLPRALLDRFPLQLSGGQRQRVALMRALMLDPALLLMDEPLAALDPMIRSDLQRDLRALFDRLKKTVVFVTHDLPEAVFIAHRMAIMRAGKILQIGPPEELIRSPAHPFVRDFIHAQRPPVILSETVR
jgi:osmoprotectant transport system ATP-binding protein